MKLNRPAFLVWNGTQQEIIEIISALKVKNYDVVYCIGEEGENNIPGVVFHKRADAVVLTPPQGMNIAEPPPLGEDILEKLYETESVLMTMMNRKVKARTVDEKKHFYYEHLRYWYSVMTKYKPEVVIFWAYPHNVANFTVYSLAKLFGIKTIFFFETWLSDRVLIQYDFKEASPALKKAIESNRGKSFTFETLSEDIKAYYAPHKNREQKLVPVYIKKQLQLFPFKKRMLMRIELIFQSIKDLSIFSRMLQFIKKFFAPNLKKEYSSLMTEVDPSKKFIYVPLHRQPEGSTSPMGGVFVDQLLMIEILSASLPPDWVIYVKENPFQWSTSWHESSYPSYTDMRYEGYYEKIARLKNVYLVPVNTDTNYLIDKSSALGVVSGRAGLESILRGKPSLVFGHAWYKDAPGVFKVVNVEGCSKVLKDINEGRVSVTESDNLCFLKSFDEVSFHAHIQPMSAKMSKITKAESTKNIISALSEELDII